MFDLFSKLYTTDFKQYSAALSEIREVLDAGNRPGMGKEDFLMLLRPYFWFVHQPGFQDVYDVCERAMTVMVKYVHDLSDENPMSGNPFLAAGAFLAAYLDDGQFDPSGWKMLFASPEIATSVIAGEFAEKLQGMGQPEGDIQALRNLAGVMKDIEGSKHIAYWCLRQVGADFLEQLSIIHSLPSGDQTYILHALDAFPGNEQVIRFYKEYIQTTEIDFLKQEAEKYLAAVGGDA